MMEPTGKDDTSYWKLGFIYYNPDDSKVILRKRSGLGWTFNFATYWSYLLIAGLVVMIYALEHYLH